MGVRCLELLGFPEYVGREISVTVEGQQKLIQAEDFLDICGKHAIPGFIGLENSDPQDPDYIESFNDFRGIAADYLGIDLSRSE